MSESKLYSLENIIDLTGGDSAFILEMIHMFISHAESFKSEAETACLNNDIALLKQKAHKFKTSAQLFQVMDLHALLIRLEDYQEFSNQKEIQQILEEAGRISTLVVAQLKEECANY